ncbi:MAG: DUF420 domain-containing protein [Flavobacteriaceae bacterium]|nr:DUF420 domain-containing protein [Flavobacteriaceae bacterium]
MAFDEKKYNKLIIAVSILIPVVVAALFGIKIPNAEPLRMLPPIYATINGLTAVCLVMAIIAIKNKNVLWHKRLMNMCILFSLAFLGMYVAYHMTSDSTPYGGEGLMRYLYFAILISHILLSIAIIPLVLFTYVRALAERFDKHKKLARYTFPIWLYVAVSGVLVYVMISPYYV